MGKVYRVVRKGVQDAAVKLPMTPSFEFTPLVRGWQVYRAVRKGVQDAAVKLLTNVDAGQLAVFNEVRSPSCCWCSLHALTLIEL